MKILAATFLLFIFATITVDAQQISYPTWEKEADTNSRLRPKFGGLAKSAEESKADAEFIATVMKEFDTAKKA